MSDDRTAKERLYRTEDGRVVSEGDPDAAYLLAAEGQEIPEGFDPPSGRKQSERPADKSVKAAENKKA